MFRHPTPSQRSAEQGGGGWGLSGASCTERMHNGCLITNVSRCDIDDTEGERVRGWDPLLLRSCDKGLPPTIIWGRGGGGSPRGRPFIDLLARRTHAWRTAAVAIADRSIGSAPLPPPDGAALKDGGGVRVTQPEGWLESVLVWPGVSVDTRESPPSPSAPFGASLSTGKTGQLAFWLSPIPHTQPLHGRSRVGRP